MSTPPLQPRPIAAPRRRLLLACTAGVAGIAGPLLLGGCGTPRPPVAADQFVAVGYLPPARGSLLLLMHLPAQEREDRRGDIESSALLAQSLVDHGYQVMVLDADVYDQALRTEWQGLPSDGASSAGESPDRIGLARADARALVRVARAACSAAASPLFIRTRLRKRWVDLLQSHAYWDGVSRPLTFLDESPGRVGANIDGTAPGISLELLATDADGRLQVRSHGGVALPFAVQGKATPVATRTLFTRAQIEEGVGVALAPLLRPGPRPAGA